MIVIIIFYIIRAVYYTCVSVTRHRQRRRFISDRKTTTTNALESQSAMVPFRYSYNFMYIRYRMFLFDRDDNYCCVIKIGLVYKNERPQPEHTLYSQRIVVTMLLLLDCRHSTTTVVTLSVAVLLTIGQVHVSIQYYYTLSL